MPEGTDLNAYATLLSSVSATRLCVTVPGRLRWTAPEVTAASAGPGASAPAKRRRWRHLALGVAGWMRYTQGVDSRVMPLTWSTRCWRSSRRSTAVSGRRPRESAAGPERYFCHDLPQNADFVGAVTAAYQQLANAVRASVWLRCN